MNYDFEEINKKVNIAIGVLLKKDSNLLKIDVHERSITHKLAEYLQTQFPYWNVDCEYNRKGNAEKTIDSHSDCTEHKKQYRVFPDIIVHQRRKNCNLLVIEVKKNTSTKKRTCDERKLKFFTSSKEYHYSYGLFIEFFDSLKCEGDWYKDGDKCPNKRLEIPAIITL